MPAWGLTDEQRHLEEGLGPWGLHPALLEPAKVTTDPVHGDVFTTVLEQAFIDSAPFQRLRRVRQLGTTHLVYPGATHTRFSHALGALRLVQDLLDAVFAQHEGRHGVPDLVAEWRRDRKAAERHVARATVVARLGALLHDIGHVPFGHSIEDDLKVLVPHDENDDRFADMWAVIAASVAATARGAVDAADADSAEESLATLLRPGGELHEELKPVIVSKGDGVKKRGELLYPFTADLVGNTICADLLDYLLRDHMNAGLPIALGRRFMSAFFIVPSRRGVFSHRLALNIVRNGHERTDVVTELLKALRYRYELSERALAHHAKLAADAMLGKALQLWTDAAWVECTGDRLAGLEDAEALAKAGDALELRAAFAERYETECEQELIDDEVRMVHPMEKAVRAAVERKLQHVGDDGLVGLIRTASSPTDLETPIPAPFARVAQSLRTHASRLAGDFEDRRLFKVAGRVGIEAAPARELHDEFGEASARSALERDAAMFAGLGTEPRILIWLPSPSMRVKIADVLVDDGTHVDRFAAYEEPRAGRGREIYGGHSRLWALWVFGRPDVSAADRDVVLAYLAERLGVAWERKRDDWGDSYWDWIDRLVLARCLEVGARDPVVDGLLKEASVAGAARGDRDTFSARRARLTRLPVVRRARAEVAGL